MSKGILMEETIDKQVRHQIARTVLSKYKLMIVRMKLSHEALKRRETVHEMLLRQIMTSFRFLRNSGQVPKGDMCIIDEEMLLRQILKGDVEDVKGLIMYIIKDNLQKQLKGNKLNF